MSRFCESTRWAEHASLSPCLEVFKGQAKIALDKGVDFPCRFNGFVEQDRDGPTSKTFGRF